MNPHLLRNKTNTIKVLFVLQKKSLRIICFLSLDAHTSPLFRELNILAMAYEIALKNCLFINKYFSKCLPIIFKNWFTLSSDSHTRWSNIGYIIVPRHKTNKYFSKCLPIIFKNWLTLSSDSPTRWSNVGCIIVPHHKT